MFVHQAFLLGTYDHVPHPSGCNRFFGSRLRLVITQGDQKNLHDNLSICERAGGRYMCSWMLKCSSAIAKVVISLVVYPCHRRYQLL